MELEQFLQLEHSLVGSSAASEELKFALNFGYEIYIEKGYTFKKENIFKGLLLTKQASP
jgi:hypothetical protein